MSKVLVLYYSSYGHIEQMAAAVAAGAREAGAEVTIKRVPETVPEAIAKGAYFKLDQEAPIATVAELADYDAIIFGAPTRFGRMPSPAGSGPILACARPIVLPPLTITARPAAPLAVSTAASPRSTGLEVSTSPDRVIPRTATSIRPVGALPTTWRYENLPLA